MQKEENFCQKTVAFATLGCKVNQYDTAVLGERFSQLGYQVVEFDQSADVYVVNTCTVTANADVDARRLVRQAYRRNPEAVKIVTGCYAQTNPKDLALIDGVHYIVGNNHKDRIVELLSASPDSSQPPQIIVDDILKDKTFSTFGIQIQGHRARAFLKIQDGCNQFCSFCIIPFARGQNRSVSPLVVMRELFRLAEQGYEEAVITGIHLGTYGYDLSPKTSLLDLILRIKEERPLPRVRLSSIDPEELTPEVVDAIMDSDCICPHLHIPLQSGNDEILSRMRRRYTSDDFRNLVQSIKKRNPDFCIGTDVIVGFPGEDEAAFADTMALLEVSGVDYCHVFSYSAREGTRAAQWPDHVPSAHKKSRSARLRQQSERSMARFHERFVGRSVEVVWDEPKRQEGIVKGVSREYLSVSVPIHTAHLGKASERVVVSQYRDGKWWGGVCQS